MTASWLLLAALAAPAQPAPKPSAPLAVVQPVLHDRRESAPAIPSGYRYVAGELMYFSFRVGGYRVKGDRVDLRWQLIATDPDGLLLWEPLSGAVSEEVTHHDEHWLPRVQQTLPLPPQLPPGVYKLKVRVADEIASTQAEADIQFTVGGNPLPRPEAFTILNPAFFRDERDRRPLLPVIYRPGDTVFARFDLAGFQIGEKNRFDVEYGLKVLRPSGKEMYAEPQAAAESDAPFYPKRVMHGALALNLTPDITPGEYSIVILARDNLGGRQAEETIRFRVEK